MANSKKRCKYKECDKLKCTEEFIKVNVNYFCDFSCAAKHGIKNKEKGAKIKHMAQKKELRSNDKPLRKKMAQQAFNAFIRARDINLPCISCDKFRAETAVSSGSNWHAGHYKTTGARAELRFTELNCHKQCANCNNHLSGNIENYRINLIKKIGLDKVEWLEGPHEPKKYTCAELKEIELKYKRKLKELS